MDYSRDFLFCVTSLIGSTIVTPSVENITALFNHITDSKICKDNSYPLRRKTVTCVREVKDIKRIARIGNCIINATTIAQFIIIVHQRKIDITKIGYFSILPISRGKHILFLDSNTLRRASRGPA